MTKLTIGTRGSDLALWQARHVQALLRKKFPEIDVGIEIIATTGDKILDKPLADIGDKALFTKEIEDALLDKKIDIAVHSLKDLPTALPDGLTIAAIPQRGPVRDAFVSNKYQKLDDLPQGATVATGSLRRRTQLLHRRPDLSIVDLRGNVNTRLRKLDESDWGGIILAEAGLRRLGFEERIAELVPIDILLPAVSQGALGIETRKSDKEATATVAELNHPETVAAVTAERAFLRRLEGGCQVPIGAHATVVRERILLQGFVADLAGKTLVAGTQDGARAEAEEVGIRLADDILARGADKILDEIRRANEEAAAK